MAIVIPIASGKGGVGKTIFTASLGVQLARTGRKCILVDLDLGGSNLHTCLGIRNRYAGLGAFISKQVARLEEVTVPTGENNLLFIPGDTLYPGTGNLPFFSKQKIIKQLYQLDADYILLDLGAGSTYNIIDFFLTSTVGLIMATPETTSILNAYSFMKSAVFRLLFRSFPARSEERKIIQNFVLQKLEGSGRTFSEDLIRELSHFSEESGEYAEEKLKEFFPWIVVNRVNSREDLGLGLKLRHIARKNIGTEMEYIGYLPEDPQVSQSVLKRKPIALLAPNAPFSRRLSLIAEKITQVTLPMEPQLFLDDEDLQELIDEREQG